MVNHCGIHSDISTSSIRSFKKATIVKTRNRHNHPMRTSFDMRYKASCVPRRLRLRQARHARIGGDIIVEVNLAGPLCIFELAQLLVPNRFAPLSRWPRERAARASACGRAEAGRAGTRRTHAERRGRGKGHGHLRSLVLVEELYLRTRVLVEELHGLGL